MKIYENLLKSMKSMNMYGIYLFRKRKMGHIIDFKNIDASHICPPKRNKLLKQRKQKKSTLSSKTELLYGFPVNPAGAK